MFHTIIELSLYLISFTFILCLSYITISKSIITVMSLLTPILFVFNRKLIFIQH